MCGPWRILVFLLFATACLRLLETFLLSELMAGDGAVPRVKRPADLPLRFRYDGTFKILQVADLHYGTGRMTRCRDVLPSQFAGCSDLNSTWFLRRMIDAEKPDLIVFSGDNIFGSSTADAAESLFRAFAPAIEYKHPWAAVLGNHDQESTMSRAELMAFISLMDYSVSHVNPPGLPGEQASIDGFGNYNLVVHGAAGSELANTSVLNLYLLDSGDREIVNGGRTYGWIKESQLQWLRKLSEGLQVQAVLLLLGGRELTSGVASLPSSSNQNPKRSNFPQRVASLMRFREKRKERNFDKKIRYTVRKEVALRMHRYKGQFTSSKSKPDDATMGVTIWDATQQWGAVDSRPQAASLCHHCGISAKATPMMRRGPDGPRTLCNACGLMWANKGTLRELAKSSSTSILQNMHTTPPNPKEGAIEAVHQQPLAIVVNGHDAPQ